MSCVVQFFFDVFLDGFVHDVLLSKIDVNKQYKNESGHPNTFAVTRHFPASKAPLCTPEHASGAPNIGDC